MQILRNLAAAAALACTAALATANDPPFDSQSDGSDGALIVDANTTIDLRLAATGSWQDPSPVSGRGIYDPSIWAVVFKYESIDISAGTVNFINHASGAPVVWLVQGDVVIAAGATVSLNGAGHSGASVYAVPGPGGFAGGRAQNAGYGPGGSNGGLVGGLNGNAGGAGHTVGGGNSGYVQPGGRAYGSLDILPLMGGSGGGGNGQGGGGGGAGGGAILTAASGSITVLGQITCNGGNGINTGGATSNNTSGGGSGGAIRLIANHISLVGATRLAVGGGSPNGSAGRIRIEAYSTNIDTGAPSPNTFPYYTTAFPGDLFQDELTPAVRIAAINGNPITLDPVAGVQSIDATVKSVSTTITIDIEAWNVEPGKTVEVKVHQATGNPIIVNASPLQGSQVYSTAAAQVTLNSAIPGDIVLRVLP
jgi:hypothetical protein